MNGTLGLHRAIRTAMRSHLLAMPPRVVSGPLTVVVSANSFTRADGSFVADGWNVGDELTGEGLTTPANGKPRLVTGVTAYALTVATTAGTLASSPSNANVTLKAALPLARAWESRGFTPPTGLPWLQEAMMPAGSTPLTIGPNKRVEHRGIYQVSLVYPADYGTTAQDDMVDAVLHRFYPGLVLTSGGFNVNIRSSSRARALPEGGSARIPVSISYEVYTLTPE